MNSFPTLAVDPVTGTVYIAWADYRNGNSDIFLTVSTDKAQTFSSPVMLNDDGGVNDQFFPWMQSVQNKSAIVWYDRRLDPANHNLDVYYTESTNQGLTWKRNVRLTDVSSNPDCCGFGGQFIGDYIGLALTVTSARSVWMDTRNGNQDIYTTAYPPSHNVCISNVFSTRTVMYSRIQSNPLNVTVTIMNKAPYNETVTVDLRVQNATTTVQTTSLNSNLLESKSVNVSFLVATGSLMTGNYTVIAHVLPVPGEVDTSDNTMILGFQVHYPGDVNGDHVVNIEDIVLVAAEFGKSCGMVGYNSASDLNNDCTIDIVDLAAVGSFFGKGG